MKAAERERDALEGAKTAAEAYIGKERECELAHASLYQIFLRDGQVRTARLPGSIQRTTASHCFLTDLWGHRYHIFMYGARLLLPQHVLRRRHN